MRVMLSKVMPSLPAKVDAMRAFRCSPSRRWRSSGWRGRRGAVQIQHGLVVALVVVWQHRLKRFTISPIAASKSCIGGGSGSFRLTLLFLRATSRSAIH